MSDCAAYLELLWCLHCQAPLETQADGKLLRCTACEQTYPIVNGIPVLINDDTSVFCTSCFVEDKETTYQSPKSRLASLIFTYLPQAELNLASRKNFAAICQALAPGARVLVVGGGVDGEGFECIRKRTDLRIVCTDVATKAATDLVCDGHTLPFRDEAFDCVIIQAVLEHVLDPVRCVAEAHRVLSPGGLIYSETPFMQQVHMGAYDFQRYTELGHRRLFRQFKELSSGVACGCGSALCWSLIYFLQSFTSKRKVKTALHILGRCLFFPLKYVDYLTHDNRGSIDGASGFYFLGAKSEDTLPDTELVKGYRGLC